MDRPHPRTIRRKQTHSPARRIHWTAKRSLPTYRITLTHFSLRRELKLGQLELAGSGTIGFSSEVSCFISAVAESNLVRQIKIVETSRVTVQATPPSIP